jgi:hypothetical protein
MKSVRVRGWFKVATRGVSAALIVAGLGEAVSFSLFAAHAVPHESAAQAAQQGLLLFYSFHRVALEVHTSALRLPSIVNGTLGLQPGFDTRATLGITFMTGTVLAIWLLARAGRAVGNHFGGNPRARALHGATVALPYALLSFAASWYVELTQRLPQTSVMVIHPARLSALEWPLVIGAISGAIGGFRSSDRDSLQEWLGWRLTSAWSRRWRGIIAGATRTLVLSLVFAFVGLVALAIVDRSSTSAYFRAISSRSVPSGIAIATPTALAIPNIAAWVIVPAMGGCLEEAGIGSLTSAVSPYCFSSYSNSLGRPASKVNREWGFLGFHELEAPSSWFLLFLTVPLAASFLGGVRAARVAEVVDRREALLVTTLAAVIFAVLMGLTLTLAWVTLTSSGDAIASNNYIRFGPYPFDGAQLALGWGLIVGGLGGLFGSRTLRRSA